MDDRLSKKEYKQILKAAKTILEISERGDLNRKYSDREDFFETSVWSLEASLTEAFLKGKKSQMSN